MKALILAAGLGTRLAPITDDFPKCMTEVAEGKTIIEKQIENLHNVGITDITVISGYKADILKKYLEAKFKGLNIIESVDYRSTNNMYSAFLGAPFVSGCEFLMMNADVFYDVSVLEALLKNEAGNAIVTDIGRYIEESMKVVEEGGKLVRISKTITPEEALGSSIDVYKFSVEGGKLFFAKCDEYINGKKELKMWSEVALNDILPEADFKACPLVGRWFEIDNHEDLRDARILFGTPIDIDNCKVGGVNLRFSLIFRYALTERRAA